MNFGLSTLTNSVWIFSFKCNSDGITLFNKINNNYHSFSLRLPLILRASFPPRKNILRVWLSIELLRLRSWSKLGDILMWKVRRRDRRNRKWVLRLRWHISKEWRITGLIGGKGRLLICSKLRLVVVGGTIIHLHHLIVVHAVHRFKISLVVISWSTSVSIVLPLSCSISALFIISFIKSISSLSVPGKLSPISSIVRVLSLRFLHLFVWRIVNRFFYFCCAFWF